MHPRSCWSTRPESQSEGNLEGPGRAGGLRCAEINADAKPVIGWALPGGRHVDSSRGGSWGRESGGGGCKLRSRELVERRTQGAGEGGIIKNLDHLPRRRKAPVPNQQFDWSGLSSGTCIGCLTFVISHKNRRVQFVLGHRELKAMPQLFDPSQNHPRTPGAAGERPSNSRQRWDPKPMAELGSLSNLLSKTRPSRKTNKRIFVSRLVAVPLKPDSDSLTASLRSLFVVVGGPIESACRL